MKKFRITKGINVRIKQIPKQMVLVEKDEKNNFYFAISDRPDV